MLRIVTWNIWWRFGPWQQRQPLIINELQAINADVVCLQEVWSDVEQGQDQSRILAEALGYNVVRSVGADGVPHPFGNAILSRQPLRLAGQAALPAINGKSGHRSVLAAWIDVGWTEQLVVTTHLEWRYTDSALRQVQLQFVVDYVAQLLSGHPLAGDGEQEPGAGSASDAGPVAILTGDLNAAPDAQELRRLTGLEPPYSRDLIFTDAWAATNDDPGYTWTRDNPNSSEALWPRRRLDYVLVSWPRSKPWANPISSHLAGVETTDCETEGGWSGPLAPSDHYAVVVDLDKRQTLGHG